MSDVVKGVYKDKDNEELRVICPVPAEDEQTDCTSAQQLSTSTSPPCAAELSALSTTQQEKDLIEDSAVQKDVPNQTTIPASSPSTAKPSRTSTASSCHSNVNAAAAVALQEPRKLSYAEVCQKPLRSHLQSLCSHYENFAPMQYLPPKMKRTELLRSPLRNQMRSQKQGLVRITLASEAMPFLGEQLEKSGNRDASLAIGLYLRE